MGLLQSFTLKFIKWGISHQPLIRNHSYLDHRYPGASALIPWLLTPGSMPRGGARGQNQCFSTFYAPPPESGGVLCYTLRNFECPSVRPSVCLSVRPSVRPSAPTTILVSATPPTVLGQCFWNFTGVLRMVWRYAYCFFRILKLFFITFFPFLT